ERATARVHGRDLLPVERNAASIRRRAHSRLRALGQYEPLARPHDGGCQPVALLEPVDRIARVTAVVRPGDPPARVVAPDRVDPALARTVGAMSRDRPDDQPGEEHTDELHEHMFAILERTRVRVKALTQARRIFNRSSRISRRRRSSASDSFSFGGCSGSRFSPTPEKMRGRRETGADLSAQAQPDAVQETPVAVDDLAVRKDLTAR